MYIGLVTIDRASIETVEVKADSFDDALQKLSKYVFEKYNSPLLATNKDVIYWYKGFIIDTDGLRVIE